MNRQTRSGRSHRVGKKLIGGCPQRSKQLQHALRQSQAAILIGQDSEDLVNIKIKVGHSQDMDSVLGQFAALGDSGGLWQADSADVSSLR